MNETQKMMVVFMVSNDLGCLPTNNVMYDIIDRCDKILNTPDTELPNSASGLIPDIKTIASEIKTKFS